MNLLAIILAILFPHDPVRRMIGHARDLLVRLALAINDARWIEWLNACPNDPDTIARFETWIDDIEAGLDLIVYLRARQILGLPLGKWTKPRLMLKQRRRSCSIAELRWRVELAAWRFSRIEHLAALRAPKLKRLLDADPLGLAPDHPIEAVVRAFSNALTHISAPVCAIFEGTRAFLPEHIRAPP